MTRKHAEEAREQARDAVCEKARKLLEALGDAGLDAMPTRAARQAHAKLIEALFVQERAEADWIGALREEQERL